MDTFTVYADESSGAVELFEFVRDIYGKYGEVPSDSRAARHSPDFRSVVWKGVEYGLPAAAAATIKILWRAWENGTPDVGWGYLQAENDFEGRAVDVFKGVVDWRQLIKEGATRGTWRMCD